MASIGYPGLFLITLLFVWRFLSSLEARTHIHAATSLAAATVAPSGAG
jgi:nitric oxide reductase subunit B